MRNLHKRGDQGAVSTEYAFMLLGIAMVVFIAAETFGSQLASLYTSAVAAF